MLRFRNEPGVLIKMLEQGMLDINVQDLGGCHIVDDDLPAHERVRPRANLPNSAISLVPPRFHPITCMPLPSPDLVDSASNTFRNSPVRPETNRRVTLKHAPPSARALTATYALSPVAEECTGFLPLSLGRLPSSCRSSSS